MGHQLPEGSWGATTEFSPVVCPVHTAGHWNAGGSTDGQRWKQPEHGLACCPETTHPAVVAPEAPLQAKSSSGCDPKEHQQDRLRGRSILQADQRFSQLCSCSSFLAALKSAFGDFWVSLKTAYVKLSMQLFLYTHLSESCTPSSLTLKQTQTPRQSVPTKAFRD